MQMFHRGGRGGTDRPGNYSNDSGFNHGPATNDGVEVNNYFYCVTSECNTINVIKNVDLEFNCTGKKRNREIHFFIFKIYKIII